MNTIRFSIKKQYLADLPDYHGEDHDVITPEVQAVVGLLSIPSGHTPSGAPIYSTDLTPDMVSILLPVIESEIIEKYEDLADCADDASTRREYRAAARYWRTKYNELVKQ